MSDEKRALRGVDELLWVLRRAGFAIATSQVLDAVQALQAIGFASRDAVRDAVAAVVVKRARDRARFDRAFDAFFAPEPHRSLWEALVDEGFSPFELRVLREALEAFAAAGTPDGDGGLAPLLFRGAALDGVLRLAGVTRLLENLQSPLQAGFYTHRVLEHLGLWRAQSHELGRLRAALTEALGEARAALLAASLERELRRAADDVRAFVRSTVEERHRARAHANASDSLNAPFAYLDAVEVEEVRRAVRVFAERLRGGERVRRKALARKGRIHVAVTLRRARQTFGVPLVLARRARVRDKPRLVLLCDISDSVRQTATFLLEVTYAAQTLFDRTRSFVFVGELGETSQLFERQPVATALAAAYAGSVVPVTHHSHYGRALRAFEARVLPDIDRRTTVVVLGDGRTNYQDAALTVLDAIRARARALVWLCPEPRSAWSVGDSAMMQIAPKCTHVLEVQCARDLEDAARLLVKLR